jgi:hypothetical protein
VGAHTTLAVGAHTTLAVGAHTTLAVGAHTTLAVGAHTTLKERQLVINHFNNGNSLREITAIIQRSHSTDQHIVESYIKGNRLTGNVRKSIKNLQHAKKDGF